MNKYVATYERGDGKRHTEPLGQQNGIVDAAQAAQKLCETLICEEHVLWRVVAVREKKWD